jgi:hypothetical protein
MPIRQFTQKPDKFMGASYGIQLLSRRLLPHPSHP